MLKPKGRQRKKLVLKQKAEEKAEEAESDKEEAEKRMDDEEPKPVGKWCVWKHLQPIQGQGEGSL